jgi:hypothetical protein
MLLMELELPLLELLWSLKMSSPTWDLTSVRVVKQAARNINQID